MGFRFQRRFKILPGLSINLSKSGASTSIGVRGAHVTVGNDKIRETVGLPGTGLSYTHTDSLDGSAAQPAGTAGADGSATGKPVGRRVGWLVFLLAVMAYVAWRLLSP